MSDPTPEQTNAQWHVAQAIAFPYDEREAATDAQLAAQAVIHELMGRRSIKRGFEDVEEDTRIEIVQALADIIREVME